MFISATQIHILLVRRQFLTWGEWKVLTLQRMLTFMVMPHFNQKYGAPPEVSKPATWLVLKLTVSEGGISMSMNHTLTTIWKLIVRWPAVLRWTSRVMVMRGYFLWKWYMVPMDMSAPMTLRHSAAPPETAPYSTIPKWDSIGHWLRVILRSPSLLMEQQIACSRHCIVRELSVSFDAQVYWAVHFPRSTLTVNRLKLSVREDLGVWEVQWYWTGPPKVEM